jgi:peptidoglycan/xylan/chitin deacetylase (PgdA/CDA1 family)
MLSKVFVILNIIIFISFFIINYLVPENNNQNPINDILSKPLPFITDHQPSQTFAINSKIPILMYHSIANFSEISILDKNKNLSHGLRIPPKFLKIQLDLIKSNGYTTITFEDLENHISKKLIIPEKPIILTFDDGWADKMTAFEMLKVNKQVANFAIIDSFIDKPNRLTSKQIKEISELMEISSHSVTHSNLTTLNEKNLSYELKTSKKNIEELIGKKINTIIYPTGAYNDNVIKQSKNSMYYFGVGTKPYLGSQDFKSPFELTRIRVECSITANLLEDSCNNLGGKFFLDLKKNN